MSGTKDVKPSPLLIICGTVVFVALMACYMLMSLYKINTGEFLVFIGAIVAMIPGTAAWRNSQKIINQTNGPLTETSANALESVERIASVETSVSQIQETLEAISQRLTRNGI